MNMFDCIKCIINALLMAKLARRLSELLGTGHPLHGDVVELGTVASAASEVYEAAMKLGVVKLEVDPEMWEGCEESRIIVGWMASGGQDPAMQGKLVAWRKDILDDLAKFLEGHPQLKDRKVEHHEAAQ